VRVDGLGSRRYFGCEARLPAAGDGPRQVRITLLPRARDVSLSAEVERGDTRRELTPMGLRQVELRADARSERELEVVRGTCSGQHPARGSHWCVLSLAADPGAIGLTARTPDFGLAPMSVSMTDPARSIDVHARYPGHLLGTVSLRVGALLGVLHGDSPGAMVAIDVPTRSETTGDTCPLGDTCIRGLVHLGATYGSYRRETELVGPTTRVTPDGDTRASYGLLEAGAGVTVAPGGTGDRLRLTGILSGVLAARTEERRATTPCSPRPRRAWGSWAMCSPACASRARGPSSPACAPSGSRRSDRAVGSSATWAPRPSPASRHPSCNSGFS
jgi:hypothetical protein